MSEQYQEIDPYRVVPSDPDCPLCGHAWSRHDPDDGLCDAPAYAALGACPCGRNRLWMAGRIAHLSRLFLSPKERNGAAEGLLYCRACDALARLAEGEPQP